VEYGQDELDVPEMPVTRQQWLVTSLAILSLPRDAHALVERSILAYLPLSVVLLTIEVEQSSVGDLDLSLVDYILVRPRQTVSLRSCLHIRYVLQDAKLNFLDHFGYTVDHLFLASHQMPLHGRHIRFFLSPHRSAQAGFYYLAEEAIPRGGARRGDDETGSSNISD
jgi:hypothetical protein